MHRRKYISAIGIAVGAGLAGCSGETGGNNSSNSSGGSGNSSSGGSESTAASGGGESTEASGGSEETEMSTSGEDGESTSMSTSEDEDSESTSSEEDSEDNSTATSEGEDSSGDSEESSSIEDSGDTDVTVRSVEVADSYSLDSVAYYTDDMGNGVQGEVTNTSDSTISYTGINVRFYDADDTRIAETLDNTEDLGAGETYQFDAIGAMMSDEADQVDSYTVEVTDSAL